MIIKFKLYLVFLILLALATLFFSYRLLDVPAGLTSDEASFGYNAALISQTLHDENNRFLPFFVLSSNHYDWRQPVTQYYLAGFFKIFGASLFNLRLSSIVITIISTILIFVLTKKILSPVAAIVASLLFLTTPLIMIQSHMGLDNIMPVPFTILWLICIYIFKKNHQRKYLLYAALSLGIAFYSYKGMRGTVPAWSILTLGYLLSDYFYNRKIALKEIIKNILAFCFGIFPFFFIIPLLDMKYPGAVFDRQGADFTNIYEFLYPYISSYDLSFLFITGDATRFHSTGRHGMMLLSTLPLFLMGIYQAFCKKGYWMFILLAFFTSPIFYGFVDSVHRASRLMSIIPPYIIITTLGGTAFYYFLKKYSYRKIFVALFIIISTINYIDFVNYYWFEYSRITDSIFGDIKGYTSYEALAKESKRLNLTPLVAKDIEQGEGDKGYFYELIYFGKKQIIYTSNQDNPPLNSLLMTVKDDIPETTKLNSYNNIKYKLYVKD